MAMSTATAVARPGYREYKAKTIDGGDVLLSTRLPSKKESDAAKLEVANTFNKAIMNGNPTRQRMVRTIRRNGLWTPEDAKRVGELSDQQADLESKLSTLPPDAEGRADVEKQLDATVGELQAFNADFGSMLKYTADQQAEEARREFLICCTTEYAADDAAGRFKKGQRVWDTTEAFQAEADPMIAERAKYEFLTCEQGIPSEWSIAQDREEAEAKKLAEDQAAQQKLAEQVAAEQAAKVDEAQKADVDGQVVLEEATPAAPTETPAAQA